MLYNIYALTLPDVVKTFSSLTAAAFIVAGLVIIIIALQNMKHEKQFSEEMIRTDAEVTGYLKGADGKDTEQLTVKIQLSDKGKGKYTEQVLKGSERRIKLLDKEKPVPVAYVVRRYLGFIKVYDVRVIEKNGEPGTSLLPAKILMGLGITLSVLGIGLFLW